MATGTSIATGGHGGDDMERTAPVRPRQSRMPITRRLTAVSALGMALSALSATAFGIAGSGDGLFVSLLCAGGFLSLAATMSLRYFSNGRF